MRRKNARQRLAEQAQLAAEVKWIVETLAKIKHQRNCLQIERLHLESLKTQSNPDSKEVDATPSKPVPVFCDKMLAVPSTSAINIMQNAANTSTQKEYGTPGMLLDGYSNNEELNLAVNHDAFGKNIMNTTMELDEEDDDYELDRDVFIDMNMFMNGA